MHLTANQSSLVNKLQSADCFRFGQYTLKCGFVSPIYIDFRLLTSKPQIMKVACDAMWQKIQDDKIEFDYICAVPYGAVPYSSAISVEHNVPHIIQRKEVKDYGTKKRIEGGHEPGKRVLVIEDVVTSGSSIMDTVKVLREEGLIVEHCVILLDRQQGSEVTFETGNIQAHRVLLVDDVLNALVVDTTHELDATKAEVIRQTLRAAAVKRALPATPVCWSVDKRAESSAGQTDVPHPVTKRLFQLMVEKQSNLCVAVDFFQAEQVLELARSIGAELVVLKVHADMIGDATEAFWVALRKLADERSFLLFEDRKLSDTGTTVFGQLAHSPYKVLEWADLVTVHATPGQAVFDGIKLAFALTERAIGCLVVTELSCAGALTKLPGYTQASVALAEANRDLVAGCICQKRCSANAEWAYFTPGVHLGETGDDKKQQFRSPDQAISVDLNDLIVVGRGVTNAKDPVAAAKLYKQTGWDALLLRDKSN